MVSAVIPFWIAGLILSFQYIIPLIDAIQILREKKVEGNEERITKIFVYFMIMAAISYVEQTFYLSL
jgi:hypothetical protein